LSELEHTRDELLMQLYQSEDAFVDKNTVSLNLSLHAHSYRDEQHTHTW